jgi:hypothetical protein
MKALPSQKKISVSCLFFFQTRYFSTLKNLISLRFVSAVVVPHVTMLCEWNSLQPRTMQFFRWRHSLMRLLCRCNKILYDSFSLFTPPISSTHIIRQCFSFRGQFSTQLRQTGDERNLSEDTFSVKNRMSSCSSQLSSETVKLQVFHTKKMQSWNG